MKKNVKDEVVETPVVEEENNAVETVETPVAEAVVEEKAEEKAAEVAVEEAPAEQAAEAPAEEKKPSKAGAAVKEWMRKRTVGLKRAPQTIPLVFLLIVSIYWMLSLFTMSKAVNKVSGNTLQVPTLGLCIFAVTLISLLILVSFLNAFPKRKKMNWFFVALVIGMVGAMVACDLVYYMQVANYVVGKDDSFDVMRKGQPYIIVHLILLGVFCIIFACLPLIKKLLSKIDTSIVVESATANMKEDIDIDE